MEQFVTDERIDLHYELVVDYYLIAGEQTYRHMGTATLAVSETAPQGTLLKPDDKRQAERLPCWPKQAEELFSRLVKQLAEKEGVTETLKAETQMLWVQKMNNIRNTAMEIVSNDLIYA